MDGTSPEGVTVKVTCFTVNRLPVDDLAAKAFAVRVEYQGNDNWVVLSGVADRLNSDGAWDFEPMPGSRDEQWHDEHRFDWITALSMAQTVAPLVMVNGLTAEQYMVRRGAMAEADLTGWFEE
jgi:hypothetical protein